jgi:hypothetical protein
MVIGMPRHGRQNSKKFGDEIPAPRSPLPAHVLAFPFQVVTSCAEHSRAQITLILKHDKNKRIVTFNSFY